MTNNRDSGGANQQEVKAFLERLKAALPTAQILFLDDGKPNAQELLNLELTPIQRLDMIRGLTASHFCSGPENMHGLKDIWIFGHEIKRMAICIEISLGTGNARTVCISFQTAEHPMTYAFKK